MQSLSVGVWLNGLFDSAGVWIYVAIAIATLIVAFEAVCIGVLIQRMVQAKKHDGEDDPGSGRAFALVAGELALGTASAQAVLAVLLILAVAGAFLLAVLLIVARIKGYDLVPAALQKEEEERLRREREAQAVRDREAAERAAAELAEAEANNERMRAEGAEAVRREMEERLRIAEEQRAEAERYAAETDSAEEPETWIGSERTSEPEPAQEPAQASGVATVGEQPAGVASGTANSGRQGKFVHMEKTVTETVRETQTTTPVQQPASAAAGGLSESEKLLKTLVEALVGQKQRDEAEAKAEAEKQAKAPAGQPDGSVPVSAAVPVDGEDDEDERVEDARGDREDDEDFVDDADDSDRFSGNERIIGYNEETGCYIVAHYRKSFEGRLIQARPQIKHYYSELKNALLAYKGTRSRVSWNADSFTNGKTPVAKINIRSNNLELYLALEPASLDGSIYHGRDVGHQKRYADTPFKYKVRSERRFGWALELVQRVCEEQGLSPIDIEQVDYEEVYPFEETEELVRRGVIREYIREEKPATSFELADDHVSVTPEMDESVVPPSANVLWELDNDAPKPEPVIEAEEPTLQTEEPSVEEAPVAEEMSAQQEQAAQAPVAQTTVTKETVRTTQIRYTEQVFGDTGAVTTAPVTYAEFISGGEMPEMPTEPIDGQAVAEDTKTDSTEETERSATEGGMGLAEEFDNSVQEEDLNWGAPQDLTDDADALDTDPFGADAPEPETLAEAVFAEGEPETPADAYADEPVEDYGESDLEQEAEPIADPDDYPEEYADEIESDADGYSDAYAEQADEQYAEQYDDQDGEQYVEQYDDQDSEQYAEQYDDQDGEQYAEQYDDQDGEQYAEQYDDQDSEQYAEQYDDQDSEQYAEQYDDQDGEQYAEQYDDQYDEQYAEQYDDQYDEQYAEQYDDQDGEQYDETDDRMRAVQIDPRVAVVDLCRVESAYAPGEIVNLETLKERGFVLDSAEILKVHASGALNTALVVEANNFSIEALSAVQAAGGEMVKVRGE